MQPIPKEQVLNRVRAENPWWSTPGQIHSEYRDLKPRAYLNLLYPLVTNLGVRRAVLLMGPRRVGKTVLIHHVIQQLLKTPVDPRRICYFSVDHPIYNGLSLEQLLEYFWEASGAKDRGAPGFIFFDEIQYLKGWEIHLKALVDSQRKIRFVASGSAAAALRLKSTESGAGRFTDFLLPPLTFHEYLELKGEKNLIEVVESAEESDAGFRSPDLVALNHSFIHYLNFGGYPEVIFSPSAQADPVRFIKSDIIDKVLLRDLPSLYGIQDIQELNYLFTTLAFNTANEVSLSELASNSGVAKNTLKKYIEYLEAAFLVRVVHRIDRNCRRFRRANFFKVYLTNPSIRSALFSPIQEDDPNMGSLAETAIFSQWFHGPSQPYYARWAGGEVDMVYLDERQKPAWAVEVKWSDRFFERPEELNSLISFCLKNNVDDTLVTTRTKEGKTVVKNVHVTFIPASVYCFTVGYNHLLAKGLHAGRIGKRKRHSRSGQRRTEG